MDLAWAVPERFVARRANPHGPGWEVLVKWGKLGYEHATWEVRPGPAGPPALGRRLPWPQGLARKSKLARGHTQADRPPLTIAQSCLRPASPTVRAQGLQV